MFLFKTDFRKDILVLLIASILLGTILVLVGGYLTDNYFSSMVSGIIGDYGEYDLLFTISNEKDEIAFEEVKKIAAETLPGSQFKTGPKVAGSTNYLLKIPEKYKNEETYVNLGKYFSDVPGIMSKTIMTEPRLSIRGFRGNTRSTIRPLIEKIEGIKFLYPTGDGLDVIVKKPELVSDVKKNITDVMNRYKMLEIRYPLNQQPEDLPEKKENILKLVEEDVENVIDVTTSNDSERISLLTSLKQMKSFLLSYASKVIVNDVEKSEEILVGSRLMAETDNGYLELKVISNENNRITALIQQGDMEEIISQNAEVYHINNKGIQGNKLGDGIINNPRQDLAVTLDKLNEITPTLNGFISQSEHLIDYSEKIGDDLNNVNKSLGQLKETSQKLSSSLTEWQKQGLSSFLGDLLLILDDIKTNAGDISDIQRDLIQTSNSLKEGAGLIEERLIYVPRNNSIYGQLEDLKDIFLRLAGGLDSNYDLVAERLQDMDPVISSIDGWQTKIGSLLKVEETLNSGADWQSVDELIAEINDTASTFDIEQLQNRLTSIQDILIELKTTQLPVVLDQLTYIQDSLPDLKEEEIVETLNLIDSYIAGEVIPGDQIQLLIEGKYNNKEIVNDIRTVIKNPAVTYMEMDPGLLQPNTRGEVFNVLSQVRAVISIIIAFIFTALIMIMDQSLIISILRLNGTRGFLYGFFSGGIIFTVICLLSQVQFPYLNIYTEFVIGGLMGLAMAALSKMLNPVDREEWEAGIALGFSPAEIMHEIIIPSGKPGLLYLLNYPKVIFKKQ
ncbi:MAG: TIGR04086 family membrane protein [Halanaerobiaceae bacterium]